MLHVLVILWLTLVTPMAVVAKSKMPPPGERTRIVERSDEKR